MKPVDNDFEKKPLQIVLYEEYYIFVPKKTAMRVMKCRPTKHTLRLRYAL